MKKILLKDLIVPLSEYATIHEDASLYEAVLELEKAQEEFDYKHTQYRHRAILVINEDSRVVGKLGQVDVIKALEPKYQDIITSNEFSRFGFSEKFIQSIREDYRLLSIPFEEACRNAGKEKVADYMCMLTKNNYISDDASIKSAIHQFVMGRHQSLLVGHEEATVGILRLSDVFASVFQQMKTSHDF